MQQLGWIDGHNIRIETRWAAVIADRFRQYAAELVSLAPDVILLDNMTPPQVREAVERARSKNKQILLEASGGITLENVRQYALAGVDWISIGGLTHSAPAADLSLEIEPVP